MCWALPLPSVNVMLLWVRPGARLRGYDSLVMIRKSSSGETISSSSFNTRVGTPKLRGWAWLVVIGIPVFALGIYNGFRQISFCGGSAFSANGRIDYSDSCDKTIAAAAVPAFSLMGIGFVLILAAIIVRAVGQGRSTAITDAPALSVASRLEDLARLKSQGLVTDAEYETKRAQLLSRL